MPIATGTNCRFDLPKPFNWLSITWKIAGQSLPINTAGAIPAYVRWDSTRFKDLDVVWLESSATLSGGGSWNHVAVAVVVNRHAVRSSGDFEYGQRNPSPPPDRKFGKAVHAGIVKALEAMNHKDAGNSVNYTRQQLASDRREATAQHISAHGNNFAVLSDDLKRVNYQFLNEAAAARRYGLGPFQVVFASSCSTAGRPIPSLAAAFDIREGAQNQVYAGFNDVVFIAGAQAAALTFWEGMLAGETAGETEEGAMIAYREELRNGARDPDLARRLITKHHQLELRFIGDSEAKLHGLYGLPSRLDEQGKRIWLLPRLTWLVAYDAQGGMALWLQ